MSANRESEIRALQTALAGVHAALWGYSRLTPDLAPEEREQAHGAFRAHRDSRIRLSDMLAAREVEPVAAKASYRLPHDLDGPETARKLAAHLEHGCTRVFAVLVQGARGSDLRRFAADQVRDCARRERDWGGEPGALPGGSASDQDSE